MDITLRHKTPSDEDFLFQLYAHSRSLEAAQTGWPAHQWNQFLKQQFEAQKSSYESDFPEANYDLIFIDGEACGRLYCDRRADEIRILDLTISPQFCGQGIGTRLLETLMMEARESRKTLSVYVHKFKPRTLNFYHRFDFTPGLETDFSVLMSWKNFRLVV